MDNYKKLQYAVITNQLSAVKKEINSGVDINSKNEMGMNILHYYISVVNDLSSNPEEFINYFIKSGIDINALTKKEKLSPIRYSVVFKRPDICKLLINSGCNIELPDENGNTPLMEAVSEFRGEENLIEIIKLLIKAGADIKKENNYEISPFQFIIDGGESIDAGGDPVEWDLRPLMKELGIKI